MSTTNDLSKKQEAVKEKAESIDEKILTLEKFIARRFDEISMEINATSQQVDMAEEGISNKFGEIMQVIQAISYSGDGFTAANAGVELDSVVDMTEDAANKILDAAGNITDVLGQTPNWDDETERQKALEAIQSDVDHIFMACSFQDITSQRIRKTLENLQVIEDRLSSVLGKLGIDIPSPENNELIDTHKASSQDDIDALFGSSDS